MLSILLVLVFYCFKPGMYLQCTVVKAYVFALLRWRGRRRGDRKSHVSQNDYVLWADYFGYNAYAFFYYICSSLF